MKKLLVAIAVAALSAASFADIQWNDWFKLNKDNPGTWTGDGDVTVEGDAFEIDTDLAEGLTHTPPEVTSQDGRKFTFDLSVAAPSDLTKLTIPEDTKGGVTIAKNNDALAFYVIGANAGSLEWQLFGEAGTPALDTSYTVTMTVVGTSVTYAIGTIEKVCDLGLDALPTLVNVLGCGTFAEISGQTGEKVVASITKDETTTTYTTFEAAVAAAGDGETIKLLENIGDYSLPAEQIVRKSVTIDANGHTFNPTIDQTAYAAKGLKCVYDNGALVTTLNLGTTDGAFAIATSNDLFTLQKAVAAKVTDENDVFKQTANIELTETFTGIGLKDSKDYCAADGKKFEDFKAGAFKGVYDGQGYSVTGVTVLDGDYNGFFNSAYKATVTNLKLGIANGGVAPATAGGALSGTAALFVGVAFDCILTNLESIKGIDAGTFEFVNAKDGAIFAGLMDGGMLSNCVNCLDVKTDPGMLSTPKDDRKIGGLVLLVQNDNKGGETTDKLEQPSAPMIVDCVNNGNVSTTKKGTAGVGGIAGYVDLSGWKNPTAVLTLKNVVNNGTVSCASGGTPYGIVGNDAKDVATIVVEGVNKAQAGIKAANKVIDGLTFATVKDGVATLVKNSAAVAGADLKVMAAGATVTLANVGESITLDTSIASATVGTTATDAYVKKEGNVYTVMAKTTPTITVTLSQYEAEWTSGLTFPTVTVEGGVAVSTNWNPTAITEPAAGATNDYVVTVAVPATDKTLAAEGSATFKVYKAAGPAPVDPSDPNAEIKPPADKTPADYAADVNKDSTLKATLMADPKDVTFTDGERSIYQGCFKAVATETGVRFVLDETAKVVDGKTIAELATADAAEALTGDTVTITTVKGLWYGLNEAGEIDKMVITGAKQATGEAIVFEPNKEGGAGFWQVIVQPTQIEPETK